MQEDIEEQIKWPGYVLHMTVDSEIVNCSNWLDCGWHILQQGVILI